MKKEMKMIYVAPSVTVFEMNSVMPLAASNVEDSGDTGVGGRTPGGTADSRGFWELDEFDD